MIEKEDKDMEELSNGEDLLMDLYEKETGKNPITARKTLRKEYLKWKSEGLQKDPIKEEIKENKKTGNLKNWLKNE